MTEAILNIYSIGALAIALIALLVVNGITSHYRSKSAVSSETDVKEKIDLKNSFAVFDQNLTLVGLINSSMIEDVIEGLYGSMMEVEGLPVYKFDKTIGISSAKSNLSIVANKGWFMAPLDVFQELEDIRSGKLKQKDLKSTGDESLCLSY